MKHIRKFESFDFEQTIPTTTRNFLTNFYSCDDCDQLWKEFNNVAENCKFCNSSEIEELHESEWIQIAKSRMTPEEFNKMNSASEEFVDLFDLKKSDKTHVN